MNPSVEQALWMLCWGLDTAMNPTYRNLFSSFEGWAYRNGLARRLSYLEERKAVLRQRREDGSGWIFSLPESRRIEILGGRDPESWWDRDWDGKWRMVLYDLPENDRSTRTRLWRWLRRHGFGLLQKSVWITPDTETGLKELLSRNTARIGRFAMFEARPMEGTDDREIVRSAWDFESINAAYERLVRHWGEMPSEADSDARLLGWIHEEGSLLRAALELDPLLPSELLPGGYLGRKTWEGRRKVCGKLRGVFQNSAKPM